ncbi:hypothetical protein OFDDKENP_00030 [Aeromonas phage B614]|nr:hypothetical protein OFDDKENP_00030 [Aeromonas phage B614]UYD58227.1 hypothetical protein JNEOFJEA_00148 [Aeromonas phage UP87]UYD58591.1 hypothetical protein IPAKJDPM_00265 [Aeromonas phage avDM14-QBC]UYD58805.1 hypothetical protein HNNIDBEH_00229 [Aeromonas phage avDM10-HWA]UYD58892.1 hypothetical protein OFOPOMKI_00025 [Aeromonas phage avDM7-IJDJ]UYD59952.1 hypothetical protein LEHPIFIF_00179 [Aeromonas phage avDM9-HANS]
MFKPTHIRKHDGITKVDFVRGNLRSGMFCWIMFKNGRIHDCTFSHGTAEEKVMEKIARKVAAEHQIIL